MTPSNNNTRTTYTTRSLLLLFIAISPSQSFILPNLKGHHSSLVPNNSLAKSAEAPVGNGVIGSGLIGGSSCDSIPSRPVSSSRHTDILATGFERFVLRRVIQSLYQHVNPLRMVSEAASNYELEYNEDSLHEISVIVKDSIETLAFKKNLPVIDTRLSVMKFNPTPLNKKDCSESKFGLPSTAPSVDCRLTFV